MPILVHMNTTELNITREIEFKWNKGNLVATEVFDNVIKFWFRSPTGDSSDSVHYHMECLSHSQAVAIANTHNKIWGLSYFHLDEV